MADDQRTEDQEQQADEPEQQEATEAEAREAAGAEAEMPPLEMNVFDLLRASVGMFAQEAWVGLGIRARPGASEVETDLRCARVAIDTLEFLLAKLADELDPDEKRAFDAELSNLRINYVRLSGSEQQ